MILGSILLCTVALYYLSNCHSYLTNMNTVSMVWSVLYILVFLWTALIDPGYRSKDIYEDEPGIQKRTIICNRCNSYR